jgi:hypothetical protein
MLEQGSAKRRRRRDDRTLDNDDTVAVVRGERHTNLVERRAKMSEIDTAFGRRRRP